MPNDPNIQPALPGNEIPPAVRAAAARADELMKQINAPVGADGQPIVAPPVPVPPVPVPPVPVVVTPPGELVVNAPLIPPTPQQPTIDEILAMQAEPGSELAKLQHAYKSLHGRHRATVDRLQTELRARTEEPTPRNFNLPQPTTEEQLAEAGATDEEIANYGEEMTAMVARIAQGAAQAEAKRLQASLAPVIENLGQMTVQDRIDKMVAYLDQQLEPWQVKFGQLNTYAPFLEWLDLTDDMSGAKRQALLETAWNSHNGSRVWVICSSFLNEVAPRTPAQPTPPAPAPNGNGGMPHIPLENLAAPGRGPRQVVPVNPVSDAKPHYTKAEVTQFYAAKARGFYSAEDAAKHEAEIFAAGREGRIH